MVQTWTEVCTRNWCGRYVPLSPQLLPRASHKQVWLGTLTGFLLCLIIGGGLIGAFYGLGQERWSPTEDYWEGSFALVASLIISVVGAALLRVSKMQEKWRVKLAVAIESKITTGSKGAFKRWAEKYAMFILPFVTVLREGIEAIVFIAGVTFSAPASSVPLPVVVGLVAGSAVGYIIYKCVFHPSYPTHLTLNQRRSNVETSNLPCCLYLPTLPGGSRSLLQSSLVPRDSKVE